MLWSCEAGRGAIGATFLDALSDLTGAYVAGASHALGAGVPWTLDTAHAPLAEVPFARATIASYRGLLATKLWYVTSGEQQSEAGLSVINADGTNQQINLVSDTVSFGSHSANGFGLGSAWVETVIDPAAGFYFILEANAFSADAATLYRGVLGSSAEPVAVDTFDTLTPGPNQPADVVQGLQIDTVNHHIYVGYDDYDNNNDYNIQPATTGIIQMDYNPANGTLSNTTNILSPRPAIQSRRTH